MGAQITRKLMPNAPTLPDPMTNHVPQADTQYFNKHMDDEQLITLFNEDNSTAVRFNLCINQFTHKGLISIHKANLLNLKELIMSTSVFTRQQCDRWAGLQVYIEGENAQPEKIVPRQLFCWQHWHAPSLEGKLEKSYRAITCCKQSKQKWISLANKDQMEDRDINLLEYSIINKASNEMNIQQLLLFLFCPDQYLKRVDLRCHKEAPYDIMKMRGWIQLRKSRIKILI